AEHAGAGVWHAQGLQQALHHAILTAAAVAVQDVEDAVDPARADRIDQRREAVHRLRIDAARAQRLEHAVAGVQRHLTLAAGPAKQYRNATERGRVGDPQRGHGPAHRAAPGKPSRASCCAAWPMSPAPIISSRSPSCSTSGSTSTGSPAPLTTTGSMRPRARIARASALASAPAIGGSPAG